MGRKICSEKTCIPIDAIRRLIRYYRDIKVLHDKGIEVISSFDLSEILGGSPEQIRKDLSYLGEFGKRGVGYNIKSLITNLENRLRLNVPAGAIVVGVGRLGMALMGYAGFKNLNISIVAGFDVDKEKVGKSFSGIRVYHLRSIKKVCKRLDPEVAIISVPGEVAQEVSERVISAGIKGILNFAPVRLSVPSEVWISHVDLSIELGALLFCSRVSGVDEDRKSSTSS